MIKNPIFLRILGIATLLLILLLISLPVSRSGETKVSIKVIPEDARVTLNGGVVSPGELYIKPGEYILKAEKEGFKTDTQNLKVEKEELSIGLIPQPESEGAKQWLLDNPEIQLERESIGGLKASQKSEEIEAQAPIISVLPYQDIYGPFRIDYGFSNSQRNRIFLEISSSTPPGRIKAMEWIRQQGYDPTDFEIKFVDFINPLLESEGGE